MNESILQFTSDVNMLNPLVQYVTMESCKEYASHAIRMQYVFGAMALIAIILMFIIIKKKGKKLLPKIED